MDTTDTVKSAEKSQPVNYRACNYAHYMTLVMI